MQTMTDHVERAELFQIESLQRVAVMAEFRSIDTAEHPIRVGELSADIAAEIGSDAEYVQQLRLAARLHDIGKIAVPDHILMKAGPLTPEEWDEMRQHALRGYHMLHDSPSRLLQIAAEIALTHHERWDGTGYPRGLRGEEIPRSGRIVAVADVFDALISARSYKPAWSLERARAHLEAEAGRHFDPACVAAFLSRWEDIVALVEEQAA